MAGNDEIREIIAAIVREEIKALAEETNGIIAEVVRAELVPGLRLAIRESIAKELGFAASGKPHIPGQSPISKGYGTSSENEMSDRHIPDDHAESCRHAVSENDASSGMSIDKEKGTIASAGEPAPKALDSVMVEKADGAGSEQGIYIYGLTDIIVSASLGDIGIDGCEVYTIPHEGISAIVHNSPLEPYKSDDNETVKAWVKQHQRVMDAAAERFGNIMPFGFDTIISPKDGATAKKALEGWLSDEHEELLRKMEKIKGKKEYGVQIFYSPSAFGKRIEEESSEVKRMREEMATKPHGLAYMYKQKLEGEVKKELDGLMDTYFKNFYEKIKGCSDDIKVEKVKKTDDGEVMMMNLSLLARDEKSLGQALDEIEGEEGIKVHFTGPWQPYSFI